MNNSISLRERQVEGLVKLGQWLEKTLGTDRDIIVDGDSSFDSTIKISQFENQWFTVSNIKLALIEWVKLLTRPNLEKWLSIYVPADSSKRVALILAGNIPAVGFHDIISVMLSGHFPVIKLSSKDRRLIPFLLTKWNGFSQGAVNYEFVEKLENYDAVIATGSNNTARYLEYYFKDKLSIIRRNRTSVAVLSGNETDEKLQALATDIFTFFGLGCRNVSRLFIPADFKLDRLFSNFMQFSDIINHHKYANNYDYNKAVYLLNQDLFWDNNFVMMRESDELFSPLSVINFSRYGSLKEVTEFISEHSEDIQVVVADPALGIDSVDFGAAQQPSLWAYADNVDTMKFLEVI